MPVRQLFLTGEGEPIKAITGKRELIGQIANWRKRTTTHQLDRDASFGAAEVELVRCGLRVVARNQRTRFGEIDLVCRDREGYVFVEVKTRSAGSFVAAAEAVDRRKLGRLARLGAGWLAMRGERDARWRVVIAALTVGVDGTRVELIEAS